MKNPIRVLAKQYKNQLLYARFKEGNLDLFPNRIDLTPIQINYLHWLEIYSSLYSDLCSYLTKELDEEILEDDFLTDCFLIWQRKEEENKAKERNKADKEITTRGRNNQIRAAKFPKIQF